MENFWFTHVTTYKRIQKRHIFTFKCKRFSIKKGTIFIYILNILRNTITCKFKKGKTGTFEIEAKKVTPISKIIYFGSKRLKGFSLDEKDFLVKT